MFEESVEARLFWNVFAERRGPLTVVFGAGASLPAGLPTWTELQQKLERDVDRKIREANAFGEAFAEGAYRALKKSENHWVSFKLIREILGESLFSGLITQYLSAPASETPYAYEEFLKLKPDGFVTLNLDRFAGDAVSDSQPRFSPPIYGKELAKGWNTLIENKRHLIYLHGHVQNPSTWVLTEDDLKEITNSAAHRAFLEHAFLRGIVLFVGVSADDAALSSRLLSLNEGGLRPPHTYWLTSRAADGTAEWAAKNSVKLIRYQARNDAEHKLALEAFVRETLQASPIDPMPALVENEKFSSGPEVSPQELEQRQPDDIRKYLSAKVSDIINASHAGEVYNNYRDFCKRYDFAIHKAFYRDGTGDFKTWFDYKLSFPAKGRGNFGEVYIADDPAGQPRAVKIVNRDAFKSDEMLQGFRRGVKSMKLVAESEVEGMVPIVEAYELPPTIVMPLIDGLSLQEIHDDKARLSWTTKLRICHEIAEIISRAHSLPSTVLHRDLKPSNIMISNYDWTENFEPDIVVLDFDMSWHKGSHEKDVIFESRDDFGFLCPEQTDPSCSYHARNTKVDTFGLGMTTYFVFGGSSPLANEPLNPNWPVKVLRAVEKGYSFDWKSGPIRLARTIVRATKMDQLERLDFFKLRAELNFIGKVIQGPGSVNNIELWGEELLACVGSSIAYHWDDDAGLGEIRSPNGMHVTVKTDPKEQRLTLQFQYTDSGSQNRTTLPRYLSQQGESAAVGLKNAGWDDAKFDVLMGGYLVSATATLDSLKANPELRSSIDEIYRRLTS